MRPLTRAALAAIVPAVLTLTQAPTAHATLTLLSSSRSVSATAHANDGSALIPGLPPPVSDASDSNSTTDPGPFDYTTGAAAVGAIPDTNHSPPYTLGRYSHASSSVSLTSTFSPTTGFSSSAAISTNTYGAQGVAYSIATSAEVLTSATFTVDAPTSFTFTGHYEGPTFLADESGTESSYRLKVFLTSFLDRNLAGFTWAAGGITPTTFSITGTFLPGTTYTLSTDLYIKNDSAAPIISANYVVPGIMNFTLSNLTPLPEPAALPALAGLTALTLPRHRRRHDRP